MKNLKSLFAMLCMALIAACFPRHRAGAVG